MGDAPDRSGFLNLRKPRGPTSHDVIDAVRAALGVNAGHAGTLDPMAEGVLPVATGLARRFLPFLRHDKEYEGLLRLGQESDTLDATGTLSAPQPVRASPEEIRIAAAALVGWPVLPVPAYSAVRMGGRRLHELAREAAAGAGAAPPATPVRRMPVFALDVVEIAVPHVRFRVSCGTGTYVRSLVAAWGRRLGCGAVLERLVRTRAGSFVLADAVDPGALRHLAGTGRLGEALIPIARALAHLPGVTLDDETARRLGGGRPVSLPTGLAAPPGQPVLLRTTDGRTIGLGRPLTAPVAGLYPLRLLPGGLAIA